MNHYTISDFWDCYQRLPESVRVGIGFRALAEAGDDGPIWFWIGSHAEYDRIIGGA